LLYSENTDDVVFNVKKIGLTLKYPKNWNKITTDDFNYFINDDYSKLPDSQKKKMPLLGLLKYKEPVDFFNPNIMINIFPYRNIDDKDELNKIITNFKAFIKNRSLKNFSEIEQVNDYKIGNVNSIYLKFNFTITHYNKDFDLCTEIWYINIDKIDTGGTFFLSIETNTLLDEKTGTRKEIHDILNTILIEKIKDQ